MSILRRVLNCLVDCLAIVLRLSCDCLVGRGQGPSWQGLGLYPWIACCPKAAAKIPPGTSWPLQRAQPDSGARCRPARNVYCQGGTEWLDLPACLSTGRACQALRQIGQRKRWASQTTGRSCSQAVWAPRCAAKPRVSRSTAVGGGRHHALLATPLACKTTRFVQYGGGWRAAPRTSGHPAALQNHAFRAVRRWCAGGTTLFWTSRCAAKPRVSRSTAVGAGGTMPLWTLCCAAKPRVSRSAAVGAGGTVPLWASRCTPKPRVSRSTAVGAGGTMPVWAPRCAAKPRVSRSTAVGAGGTVPLWASRCSPKPRVSRGTAVGAGGTMPLHISTRKKRVRALSHDEETDRSWLTLRFFAPDHSQNFLRAGSTPDAEEVAAEASAVETFSKA